MLCRSEEGPPLGRPALACLFKAFFFSLFFYFDHAAERPTVLALLAPACTRLLFPVLGVCCVARLFDHLRPPRVDTSWLQLCTDQGSPIVAFLNLLCL
jgi:hypothetical protein